jgi:hypothetical protein
MKKKQGVFWGITALVLAAIFTLGGCPSPTGGNGDDDNTSSDTSHLELLRGLGINTSLGSPRDPKGNALPTGYNPLGAKGAAVNAARSVMGRSGRAAVSGGGGRGTLY